MPSTQSFSFNCLYPVISKHACCLDPYQFAARHILLAEALLWKHFVRVNLHVCIIHLGIAGKKKTSNLLASQPENSKASLKDNSCLDATFRYQIDFSSISSHLPSPRQPCNTTKYHKRAVRCRGAMFSSFKEN